MNQWSRSGLLAGMMLLAFGCDNQGRPVEEFGLDKLVKGVSSESDVRIVMGQPEAIWEEEDGSRSLQYPKGPEGIRTWEFTVDKSGKLKNYRQLLTEDAFTLIKPGMSKDEVRHMLGKPRSVAQYNLKNEEAWDWRYFSSGTVRLFNVHFDMDSGKVTMTSRSDGTES